jgi:hypothetical protein
MNDRALRTTSLLFVVALLVHGADHVRRGIDVMTTQVLVAGTVQFALAFVAVVLVLRRHPAAAAVAAGIGLGSALGFVSAHLLPHWGAFSDAYVGSPVAPGVTAFSWVTAILEIAADVAFGWVGLRAFHRRLRPLEPAPAA